MTLISKARQMVSLSDETISWMNEHIETFTFKKGETVLREGQVCNYLYYVNSGMLCGYELDDHKEICHWLSAENDFATSYYSFISRKPSYESIECCEKSTVQAIGYSNLNKLFVLFPETERLGRLLLEEYYSRLEERMISIRFKTAKERYRLLLQSRPDMMKRAPLGRIASYLGMSQETLSRIRAEI